MADVNLTIKVVNADAVNKLKEVQTTAQKVYDTAEKGAKRQKGILQEIEDRLSSLQKRRQAAFSYEDIEKYNKKIQETKLNLQEYEKAGLDATGKVEKSTSKFTASLGKAVLGLVTLTTAWKILKDTAGAFYLKSQLG